MMMKLQYHLPISNETIQTDIERKMRQAKVSRALIFINGHKCGIVDSTTRLEDFVKNNVTAILLSNPISQFTDAINPGKAARLNQRDVPMNWISFKHPIFAMDKTYRYSLTFDTVEERTARCLIGSCIDRCYVVFNKNDSYRILSKQHAAIKEFEIVIAESLDPLTRIYTFNLQEDNANLYFQSGIRADSLYSFITNKRFEQQFSLLISTKSIQVFHHLPYQKQTIGLQNLTLKTLLINQPDFSWFSLLPNETLQKQALIYFLDMFIDNFSHMITVDTFNLELQGHLYFRKHYDPKAIKSNLDILHKLALSGNEFARDLFTGLVFKGLGCKPDVNRHALFRAEVLFQDLKKYREITQNQDVFPLKIVRDYHLMQFYTATNDDENKNKVLKQINILKAIEASHDMFCDSTLKLCIQKDEFNQLEKLIKVNCLLFRLIELNRISLADWLKDKLPVFKLRERDIKNRNILHYLIDYLSKNKREYGMIVKQFSSISRCFPEMLVEQDKQGRTALMAVEALIANDQFARIKEYLQLLLFTQQSQAPTP